MGTWEISGFERSKPHKREGSRGTEQLKKKSRDDAANKKEVLIHWEDIASIKQKWFATLKKKKKGTIREFKGSQNKKHIGRNEEFNKRAEL